MKKEWYIREATVLGLGAITEGCMDNLSAYTDEFLPVLIKLFYDPNVKPFFFNLYYYFFFYIIIHQ